MSPLAEGAGVLLSYTERGSGPPVLLVHGMASGAQDLAVLADALAGQARVISYDRRGYGASGAPEPYTGTTVMEQAQDAAELLAALGIGEAVIAGDGFGALVALDLLHRHPGLARAAVLADPPLLAFVPSATEALGLQRQRVDEALRERGPEAGVEAWLGGRVQGEALQRAEGVLPRLLRGLRGAGELAGHARRAAGPDPAHGRAHLPGHRPRHPGRRRAPRRAAAHRHARRRRRPRRGDASAAVS